MPPNRVRKASRVISRGGGSKRLAAEECVISAPFPFRALCRARVAGAYWRHELQEQSPPCLDSEVGVGRLTTHVLDTAQGRPAAGLALSLNSADAERRELVSAVTNQDGRCDRPLLEGTAL